MEKPQMWFCQMKCENSHPLVKVTDVSFFYLRSCLSTQFLYRTAVKATFNVKKLSTSLKGRGYHIEKHKS